MIIRGRFRKCTLFCRSSSICVLSRTGLVAGRYRRASRTTILDRDVKLLGIPAEALEPALLPIVGIGGSVRSFLIRDVETALASEERDVVIRQDLWIMQHDLGQLPPEEVSRILRLPSVMGRDFLNRFHFTCDYQAGNVRLER